MRSDASCLRCARQLSSFPASDLRARACCVDRNAATSDHAAAVSSWSCVAFIAATARSAMSCWRCVRQLSSLHASDLRARACCDERNVATAWRSSVSSCFTSAAAVERIISLFFCHAACALRSRSRFAFSAARADAALSFVSTRSARWSAERAASSLLRSSAAVLRDAALHSRFARRAAAFSSLLRLRIARMVSVFFFAFSAADSFSARRRVRSSATTARRWSSAALRALMPALRAESGAAAF